MVTCIPATTGVTQARATTPSTTTRHSWQTPIPQNRPRGVPEGDAAFIAGMLIRANLRGHDSHGVIRVPQYVGQVRDGTIVPNRTAEVVRETEAVTVLDGHFGYGQIVGEQAVQAAIDKARRHGIGMAALRHSAHLGRLGDWAEMAAAAGLASLHFVNATGIPLRVVPHGGRVAVAVVGGAEEDRLHRRRSALGPAGGLMGRRACAAAALRRPARSPHGS